MERAFIGTDIDGAAENARLAGEVLGDSGDRTVGPGVENRGVVRRAELAIHRGSERRIERMEEARIVGCVGSIQVAGADRRQVVVSQEAMGEGVEDQVVDGGGPAGAVVPDERVGHLG